MDFSKIHVLVMDGGGKQTYGMVAGLKEIGCTVTVLCLSKWDTCYVSNLPDERILTDRLVEKGEDAYEYMLSLLKTGKYDVLMPIGEMSTDFVTSHEDEFGKYAKLACAPREIYIKAFDKQKTFDQAMESGIPCSYTRKSEQDIEEYLAKAHFPIIIKPRSGLGSIGFHKFQTEAEFRERLASPDFKVDDYVVQEFVEFDRRIGVNLFVDRKGRVCSSFALEVTRWFPIDAGSAVLVKTIDAPLCTEYTEKLFRALGWQGFAVAGFMIDRHTGEPRLLEINGRIPQSVRMGHLCGFNISRQFIEMVYGEEVTGYPRNTQFGKYFRHFDTDLAWFLHSPDRFHAKPSWFSWQNTYEVLYNSRDRKPFFSHLFRKIFLYNSIMKKKRH